MIQRIQTIYLALGILACLVCLCLPIAELQGGVLSVPAYMYNGCVVGAQGDGISVSTSTMIPLFGTLVVAAALACFAIFTYRRRSLQMKLCVYAVLLIVIWISTLAFIALLKIRAGITFRPLLASVLPLLAVCLFLLARRSIAKDERLVRSADRIR